MIYHSDIHDSISHDLNLNDFTDSEIEAYISKSDYADISEAITDRFTLTDKMVIYEELDTALFAYSASTEISHEYRSALRNIFVELLSDLHDILKSPGLFKVNAQEHQTVQQRIETIGEKWMLVDHPVNNESFNEIVDGKGFPTVDFASLDFVARKYLQLPVRSEKFERKIVKIYLRNEFLSATSDLLLARTNPLFKFSIWKVFAVTQASVFFSFFAGFSILGLTDLLPPDVSLTSLIFAYLILQVVAHIPWYYPAKDKSDVVRSLEVRARTALGLWEYVDTQNFLSYRRLRELLIEKSDKKWNWSGGLFAVLDAIIQRNFRANSHNLNSAK